MYECKSALTSLAREPVLIQALLGQVFAAQGYPRWWWLFSTRRTVGDRAVVVHRGSHLFRPWWTVVSIIVNCTTAETTAVVIICFIIPFRSDVLQRVAVIIDGWLVSIDSKGWFIRWLDSWLLIPDDNIFLLLLIISSHGLFDANHESTSFVIELRSRWNTSFW